MTKLAQHKNNQSFSLRTYWLHHRHAWRHALRQITKNPLASLLTIAVISITLSLPTGLFVVLNNLQGVTQHWNKGTNISAYLKADANSQQVQFVREAIGNIQNIKQTTYISPEQGLTKFSQQTGLNDILKTLGENPLPGVFIITPMNQSTPALNLLRSQLSAIANISSVKIDMQWIKRLNAVLKLLTQFTYGLVILLAIAVLLIIGNTIRMNIQSYRQEIEVMKLVGASANFIRRPFLYSGLLYGLCAAIFSAVILDFFILWLQTPLNHLTALYGTHIDLQGLNILQTFELIIIGIVLGWLGSRLVVSKYLKRIQPDQ